MQCPGYHRHCTPSPSGMDSRTSALNLQMRYRRYDIRCLSGNEDSEIVSWNRQMKCPHHQHHWGHGNPHHGRMDLDLVSGHGNLDHGKIDLDLVSAQDKGYPNHDYWLGALGWGSALPVVLVCSCPGSISPVVILVASCQGSDSLSFAMHLEDLGFDSSKQLRQAEALSGCNHQAGHTHFGSQVATAVVAHHKSDFQWAHHREKVTVAHTAC
jgi:hypothetical protein